MSSKLGAIQASIFLEVSVNVQTVIAGKITNMRIKIALRCFYIEHIVIYNRLKYDQVHFGGIMNAIKKLSGKELEKLINQAASELERRKRIDSLNRDIQKVLSKHKVTKAELSTLIDTLKGKYKAPKSKTSTVTKVPPKFRNPAGTETWTGRGRTPKWVAHICGTAGISVEEFKRSTQYLI